MSDTNGVRASADTVRSARAVALYLPQFHPIPENDSWWGAGFTEWTNVTKARPLFRGHVQPHLPADLGFYDLRVPETREAQAELARAAGIEAFCYWHYWFGGARRLLDRPFREVLSSGTPTLKFCLGWANESWTGVWHGAAKRVLMEQVYPGKDDFRAHFDSLLEAFRDPRYLRVNDRPVFHVYRPGALPNAAEFVDLWQGWAQRAGLGGLYLVAGSGAGYSRSRQDGFDGAVYQRLPFVQRPLGDLLTRVRHKVLRQPVVYPYATEPLAWPREWAADSHMQPCIVPNWDNTPRSGRRGVVLTGATPEKFRVHVRDAVARVQDRPAEERLVWVKSWNEWAEGNYLEPDREFGHAWIDVLGEELRGSRPPTRI